MFAQVITRYQAQRNATPKAGSKAYLSMVIGIALSGTVMSAQAATQATVYNEILVADANVEYLSDDSPQVVYERMKNPNMPIDRSKLPSNAFVAQQTQLFYECTQVQTSAARLACFDKVAKQGETPSFTMNKQPVDLAKTFKTTISGSPQVVFANETLTNDNTVANDDVADSMTAQVETAESLDTAGLTKTEAQVLENVGVTQDQIEKYSPLSLAYDLDQNSERGTWTVRPYNPNYVLPLFYTFDPNLNPTSSNSELEAEAFTSNDIRNTELKFQVSFKSKVGEDLFDTNADLWFGYTQQSHWQVYNEDNSRPFRATDYQPEVFLTQPVTANLPFGGRLRMLGAGAIHHSNGQDDPISRSWNRAYLMAGAEWGKLSIIPKVWARISEDEDGDDNPDIEDFMGYGDLTFLYDLPSQQSLSGTLRYNPSTSKGAAQIDYIYPLSENVNGYVQLFHGYGESIMDYNYENTAIGFGIVLNDWKGF